MRTAMSQRRTCHGECSDGGGGEAAGEAAGAALGVSVRIPSSSRVTRTSTARPARATRARGPCPCSPVHVGRSLHQLALTHSSMRRHLGELMLEVDDIMYTMQAYGANGGFDATGDAAELEKARFKLYRDVVAWRYGGNPLGSKNRKRLPTCCEHRIRTSFPNPICSEASGCDYLDGCISRGAL